MSDYLPLPPEVLEICRLVAAPPRLIAHLTLVHDVAEKLVNALHRAFPGLDLDGEAVLFGAATHDIGKSLCPEELSGPGAQHERYGPDLLKRFQVSEARTRFAYTHANWQDKSAPLEDLLVALADTCWKGKRLGPLEEEIVRTISVKSEQQEWEVFGLLDEILQQLTSDADARLAWQASFPVTT
ncbi:MAG TPA: HD domain-containing protein [Candidatus Angelobacter sp.]|nr:HD domain-containing protein [Candidatus Angelobacter sp.]